MSAPYQLKSDAALAYDEAARVVKPRLWMSNVNFADEKDHVHFRSMEMQSTGLHVDLEETLAYISVQVKIVASKIKKALLNSINTKYDDTSHIMKSDMKVMLKSEDIRVFTSYLVGGYLNLKKHFATGESSIMTSSCSLEASHLRQMQH